MECRSPGSPTWPGRLIESCFAVQSGSAGTGFWIRNQSLPGVECRVQYKPRVIRQDLNAGTDDEDHEEQVEEVLPSHPAGKPVVAAGCDDSIVPG